MMIAKLFIYFYDSISGVCNKINKMEIINIEKRNDQKVQKEIKIDKEKIIEINTPKKELNNINLNRKEIERGKKIISNPIK